MPANHKKPHLEVPEEELLDNIAAEDEDDEEQPVLPQSAKPITVNEADWVDQLIDVPIDDDEDIEHS